MQTHWHLVCETPEGNISRFMHSLTTAYTVYYNIRHRRHGHRLCVGTDSAISRQLRKLRERLAKDRRLERKLRKIERTLEEMRPRQGGDVVKS